MKITLKLFADLAEYLPPDASDNEVAIDAPAPLTSHQLLDRFRVPRMRIRVLMKNGEFVPAEQRDAPLNDGDVISAWPAIQGG